MRKQCDGAVLLPLYYRLRQPHSSQQCLAHCAVSCAREARHQLTCHGSCRADDAVGCGRRMLCTRDGRPDLPNGRCAHGGGAAAAPPASPAGWRTTHFTPID
jgi:hypothetical protein